MKEGIWKAFQSYIKKASALQLSTESLLWRNVRIRNGVSTAREVMADAREIAPDVAALASGKSPPASKSAIRSLPLVYVSVDDLLEESNKECLICLEGHRIGSLAYKLACGHLFHTPCITKWLQMHCTCEFTDSNAVSDITSALVVFNSFLAKG